MLSLKLANLFLDAQLGLKLGDFGLSATVPAWPQVRRTVCGTPNYIAPEVLRQLGHSAEVDIWAFGVLLFHLLTGRTPFSAPTHDQVYERILENAP